MPSGYTADIEKGITFEKFALDCAKNFGALITMRDDPKGTKIPKFKPTSYHVKSIEKDKKEKNRLLQLTEEEKQEATNREYREKILSNKDGIHDKHVLRDKYETMLSDVRLWKPPSEGHEELKRFMVNQITESIDFDCATSYYETEVVKLSPDAWLKEKLGEIDWNIDYHEKENRKEIERVNDRNDWVEKLKNSLK